MTLPELNKDQVAIELNEKLSQTTLELVQYKVLATQLHAELQELRSTLESSKQTKAEEAPKPEPAKEQ